MSVILTMIDGTRPDAITASQCPNIQSLIQRGASSMTAQSIMPSITLPCHMSIFHSVPPERHNVVSNSWSPMARPLPGLVELAAIANLHCASFYNWEPLRNLSQPGCLKYAFFQANSRTQAGDQAIAEAAASYISQHRPDFAFVYFGTVDETGHDHGWMSAAYLAQLERVDQALGTLLAALSPEDSLLLQSDHGGHDRSHGTDSAEDMTIPWLLLGPQIKAGHILQTPVSLLDTAPTLARLLGFSPHEQWEGQCVDEAFIG